MMTFLLIYPWNCGLYPEEKTKDSILMQNGFLMGTPEWFFLRSGQQFGKPLANILPFAIDSFIFGSLIRPFSPSLNLCVCNLKQQKVWAIPPLTTSLMLCMSRKPAGEINNWLGQWHTDKKFMLWSGILRNIAFKAVFFNNPDYSILVQLLLNLSKCTLFKKMSIFNTYLRINSNINRILRICLWQIKF